MENVQKKKGEKSDRNKSPAHTSRSPGSVTATRIYGDADPNLAKDVSRFLKSIGAFSISRLPGSSERKDFYSDLLRGLIKVEAIARGKITCAFPVVPGILNTFDGLHGGLVAMMAERVATACARTVVAEDKELHLAELSVSYLSAALINEELVVEASVAKTGRNVTVVTVDIRRKHNRKLMYLSHFIFFHAFPAAKL
ncbi:hypothetical protein V2J09_024286 [Rumex salicifolius]